MNKTMYRIYQRGCTLQMRGRILRAYRRGRISGEWRQYLFRMAEEFPSIHTTKMLDAFFGREIRLVRRSESAEDLSGVTVLCVEKDSRRYLRRFLAYYRKLGVRHFLMIDNGSSDGSAQYLRRQKDVTLYAAPFPFEHHRQVGWMLQAVLKTGTDRWYLRADADEFFTWPGMEDSSLDEVISGLAEAGMGTCRVLMADMYPEYRLLDPEHSDTSFMRDYCWFDDAESYVYESSERIFYGGMRERVTGARLRMDKYALFDASRGCLPVMNHDVTGVHLEKEREICGILRHYKFLPSEKDRYAGISEDPHSGYGSYEEVKKYGRLVRNGVTAFGEHSIRYENSGSIRGFISEAEKKRTPGQFPGNRLSESTMV